MGLFKEMSETTLHVDGMHCQKCVARVKNALESVDGVTSVEVSLENERAVVQGCAQTQALIDAVRAIGFTAEAA